MKLLAPIFAGLLSVIPSYSQSFISHKLIEKEMQKWHLKVQSMVRSDYTTNSRGYSLKYELHETKSIFERYQEVNHIARVDHKKKVLLLPARYNRKRAPGPKLEDLA